MMFAPLKLGGNRRILYKGKFYELSPHHKVVFARNPREYGGGRVEQKVFADGSVPEMHLEDFPACYIYEQILKDSIYDKLHEEIKSRIPEREFREKAAELIKNYQRVNAANKGPREALTVRELQEQALEFVAERLEDLSHREIRSENFISTDSTIEAEKKLDLSLRIRALQRLQAFPNDAVGINGIIFEGDSGTGKSEMIQAMFLSRGIIRSDLATGSPGEVLYYKIDASLSIDEKKKIIIKAFEEGNIIWIDELNACIDDGLEKILNAALTGEHPVTKQRSANPGFMCVASVNQISLEGRSPISPAILHRMHLQKTKSLKEYSENDLIKIVNHWFDLKGLSGRELIPVIVADFKNIITNPEKSSYANLRILRNIIENPKFLAEYARAVEGNEAIKYLREALAAGKKPVTFKDKELAIEEFIAANSRIAFNPSRKPEFLTRRTISHFTLSSRVAISKAAWEFQDYAVLKDLILLKGYGRIFKFNDSAKTIDILVARKALQCLEKEVIEKLINIFPQFSSEILIKRLKSEEAVSRDAEAIRLGTIFTEEGLQQELFFRQENLAKPIPEINNFDNLLSGSFCIGEWHEHKASKRILFENMEVLKSKSYKTIFLEGLIYDSLEQDLLNEFLDPSYAGSMNPALEKMLKTMDKANNNLGSGYYEIILEAKKFGLRVVGLESEYSFNVPEEIEPGDNIVKRCKDMNYAAKFIIEKEAPEQKWVAIMGNAHMKTNKGVVGVGELMGVPSVLVYDGKSATAEATFAIKRTSGVESEARIACNTKSSIKFADIKTVAGISLKKIEITDKVKISRAIAAAKSDAKISDCYGSVLEGINDSNLNFYEVRDSTIKGSGDKFAFSSTKDFESGEYSAAIRKILEKTFEKLNESLTEGSEIKPLDVAKFILIANKHGGISNTNQALLEEDISKIFPEKNPTEILKTAKAFSGIFQKNCAIEGGLFSGNKDAGRLVGLRLKRVPLYFAAEAYKKDREDGKDFGELYSAVNKSSPIAESSLRGTGSVLSL